MKDKELESHKLKTRNTSALWQWCPGWLRVFSGEILGLLKDITSFLPLP